MILPQHFVFVKRLLEDLFFSQVTMMWTIWVGLNCVSISEHDKGAELVDHVEVRDEWELHLDPRGVGKHFDFFHIEKL